MAFEPLFPYFGGKRLVAAKIWEQLGYVDRYVEPFFGSGAVLLGNPNPAKSELVNDVNHHVANLWRSLQVDPDEVFRMASAPGSEVELNARAEWLKSWQPPDFNIPDACDPRMAGVWLWYSCVVISPKSAHLHRGDHGKGIKRTNYSEENAREMVKRISRMQVMCGDWSRCVTPAALRWDMCSTVGVFLDPPYGVGEGVTYEDGTGTVARDVWEWAIANGDNPKLRIVVAGYEDDRVMPVGWYKIDCEGPLGYGNQRKGRANNNRLRERLWCSPACLNSRTDSLFF